MQMQLAAVDRVRVGWRGDDAALVDGLRHGDSSALERLIRDHGSRMFGIIRRLTRSEADARDAFALACSDAVRTADGFDGVVPVSAWLRRLAVRAALATLASRSADGRPIEALLPAFDSNGKFLEPWPSSAGVPASAAGARSNVVSCIDALPDDYRSAFVLCDVEGLRDREAAELLGLTPSGLRTRLHHARMALVTLLRPQSTAAQPADRQ